MSAGGPVTVLDILDLHTFSSACDWCFSPDGLQLALTLGRPLSSATHHTNAAGGQPEEREIWLVDLTSDNPRPWQLLHDPRGQVAFAPCWNPDGRRLAFVRAESAGEVGRFGTRMPLWRAFISIWDRDTGATIDLAPVVLDPGGGHTPVFCWLDDRHLRCMHSSQHEERLSGLWQESEATLGARLIGLETAEVFDTPAASEPANRASLLSVFEIGAGPVVQLCPVLAEDVSTGPSWVGLIRGGALMNGPDRGLERYWPKPSGVVPEATSEPVETGVWQVGMDHIARDPDTGRVWALWRHVHNQHFSLLTLAPGAIAFRLIGATRFSSASAPHLCADGTVLFRATEDGGRALQWFACPPGAGEDGAAEVIELKDLADLTSEALLEFPGGIFLANSGTARHLGWSASGEPQITLLPAPAPHIGTQFWPQFARPEVAVRAAEVSLFRAASSEKPRLLLTQSGRDFTLLDVPEAARIKAVAAPGSPYPRLAALMHDADGSHVLLCSDMPPRQLVSFNRAAAHKAPARALFVPHPSPEVAAEPALETFSELLLPPSPPPASGYPVLAHLYPKQNYPPHAFPYAHAASVPHAHNPYIAVAAGFAVLHVAMPLREEVIAQGAEALFEACEQNLEIALELASGQGIDRDRVALMGHSWGAALALNLLARSSRLRGAIGSAGLYNPLGWYGCFESRQALSLLRPPDSTSTQMTMQSCFATAPPFQAPEAYLATAPMLRVPALTRPILLLHGTRDFVPVAQAEQMFSALRTGAAGARLVRFPGEGHIISAPGNVTRFHREILMFLEKVLKVESV
jgi:dipeptidyl aminopeptidase/acylaminoacyl peptidase